MAYKFVLILIVHLHNSHQHNVHNVLQSLNLDNSCKHLFLDGKDLHDHCIHNVGMKENSRNPVSMPSNLDQQRLLDSNMHPL